MNFSRELELFLGHFGVSLGEAKKKLAEISLSGWDQNLGGCFHHLYFAMVSLIMPDVKNILELGTGLGETTLILSKLFPAATIYTLDIPKSDRDYTIKAWRGLEKKKKGMERFKQNINRKNIIYIAKNSFFLTSLELPEKFEVIWIDGGHTYPVVAWDMMIAYNRLKESGFMFMHDYSVAPSVHSQVREVLNYILSRIKEKIWLLPSNAKNKNAKTACIQKEGK